MDEPYPTFPTSVELDRSRPHPPNPTTTISRVITINLHDHTQFENDVATALDWGFTLVASGRDSAFDNWWAILTRVRQ